VVRITVWFLGGDPELHVRVRAVAAKWTGPGMANVEFLFLDNGPADIRIVFGPGQGSWSYLGTQCRQVDPSEPTMNYGWLTPNAPDDVLRPVVLHEFGHALGLIHEHQHPRGDQVESPGRDRRALRPTVQLGSPCGSALEAPFCDQLRPDVRAVRRTPSLLKHVSQRGDEH
jgi:hypothetical protein